MEMMCSTGHSVREGNLVLIHRFSFYYNFLKKKRESNFLLCLVFSYIEINSYGEEEEGLYIGEDERKPPASQTKILPG
jgi:hypothetical protein